MRGVGSRTIDWWPVHLFVVPLLDEVRSWPLVGSLTWQQLESDDPAKVAAIYDAARHHALRIDTAQAALADASRAVSKAADWPQVSREIRRRSGVYLPREVA